MAKIEFNKRSLLCSIIIILVLLLSISACNRQTPSQPIQTIPPEKTLNLHLPLQEIYPGDYLIFFVENYQTGDEINIVSKLFSTNPKLVSYGSGKLGLQGISYRTEPGSYLLKISVNRGGTIYWEREEHITIKPKTFKTQYLRVTAQQAAKRDPQLWEKDAVLINKAKSASSLEPLWNKEFIIPVTGRISTEYGEIRYINKVETGRHAGIDIAAPRGTPVKAANSGIVALSLPLNVTGNTIIIDHGVNLFSSYAHLDRLLVSTGQKVTKGEIIGEVGSTGFSTGPHLHWTVSTGPAFLNPWLLIEKDPLSYLQN